MGDEEDVKEMKMRLIKIDNKTIYSLVFGVMCLLTIFAITVSVKNDIFRDSMYVVRRPTKRGELSFESLGNAKHCRGFSSLYLKNHFARIVNLF